MARKGRSKNYRTSKKKSKYCAQEKFAYIFGQVTRGLNNPESRITESFNNGKKVKDKKPKKSLY